MTDNFDSAEMSSASRRTFMVSSRAQWVEDSTTLMHCPTARPGPYEVRASEESVAWAVHFGLVNGSQAISKVRGIRCGSCAAHVYPEASAEVVSLAAKLITWLFLFDDAVGEGRNVHDTRELMETFVSYERLLRTGDLGVNPTGFHAAILDLRESCIQQRATAEWLERFADSMSLYFKGCILEFPLRRAKVVPSLAEYRRLRAWSIGMPPVYDIIELGMNEVLTNEESCCPGLGSLREQAALLCAWVNDVYSYNKEKKDGDILNLVGVLMKEMKLSEPEAFVAAAEVFNMDLAQFDDQLTQLEASAPLRVVRYAHGLRDWIRGNFSWTGTSLRYGRLVPN
jgi:hypothetical protein